MDPELSRGVRAVHRCDALGAPPFSETVEALTRRYLTAAHREAVTTLSAWMTAAGMTVHVDPLGTLIGRYEAERPGAPAIIIGSHIDSVPNGGRYDGPLGIMIGLECVAAFHARGERLPFALEVVAFGDEEGSRFPASMLGSQAIAGVLDPAALDIADAQGVRLSDALREFGLAPEMVGQAARSRGEILAYIEPHIEQGPLLEADGLAIGAVSSIAAQVRLRARFVGVAGHAGTTPMRLRADALAAAAEAVLAVERACSVGADDVVGTVGKIQTSTQAFNVIVGEAEIGVDIRAAEPARRDAVAAQVRSALEQIAARRGLRLELTTVQDLPGRQCDADLTERLGSAVERVVGRDRRLMSGAGHDAMVMGAIAPVAMLFIRCTGGVSHHRDEQVTAEDVSLAIRALIEFITSLGARE